MGIQEIIVILLAVGALVYLVRFFRKSVSNHDCGDCTIAQAAEDSQLKEEG